MVLIKACVTMWLHYELHMYGPMHVQLIMQLVFKIEDSVWPLKIFASQLLKTKWQSSWFAIVDQMRRSLIQSNSQKCKSELTLSKVGPLTFIPDFKKCKNCFSDTPQESITHATTFVNQSCGEPPWELLAPGNHSYVLWCGCKIVRQAATVKK